MSASVSSLPIHSAPQAHAAQSPRSPSASEPTQLRHLQSLVTLIMLYAGTLLFVSVVSDSADVGCIFAGIAGHVLWATGKTALAWREASWIDAARHRVARQ